MSTDDDKKIPDEENVRIRLFEERDAQACARIWVTGLSQTADASKWVFRPLIRWGMTKLSQQAMSPDGDIGPDGCNLGKVWCGSDNEGDDDMNTVDRALFVAENKDDEVVGLCCVKRGQGENDVPPSDYPIFSIWRMSVDEKARRFGVGRRLMEACEHWAKDKGGTKMTLVTGNSIAANFYKRVGYSKIDFWGIRHDKSLIDET